MKHTFLTLAIISILFSSGCKKEEVVTEPNNSQLEQDILNDFASDLVYPNYSEIYSREILRKIVHAETGWENQVPEGVAEMIKDKGMFGYKEEVSLREFT